MNVPRRVVAGFAFASLVALASALCDLALWAVVEGWRLVVHLIERR